MNTARDLLIDAEHAICLRRWAEREARDPDVQFTQHAREAHAVYADHLLAHAPLAAALETDRLAREWLVAWEKGTQWSDFDDSARWFRAFTDHLRATTKEDAR